MAKIKPLILDVGAGDTPLLEATHAIDTEKPKRMLKRLKEYRIGDFQNPPKDWEGKFDKVVSRAALGTPSDEYIEYFKSPTRTGKALDFVTKPNATLEIETGNEYVPEVQRILKASKFKITSIEPKHGPHGGIIVDSKGNPAGVVVKAAKGSSISPRTIQRDKDDPTIIYDPNRSLAASLATSYGEVIIGIKDNPTKAEIAETIRHEKSHLGHCVSIHTTMLGGSRDYLVMAREELQAYRKERKLCSPTEWNKVLPIRIKSLMAYLTWVTKADQRKIKTQAKQILAPKKGGGNDQAICQAQADLAQWWLEEEKPPKCRVVVVRRSIKDIERELQRMTKGAYGPEQRIKPGVAYTSSGRLSRKRHKGWKKVRFA